MAHEHRERSLLGFTLMVTQAFFYNAVLFTYGLVLLRYYSVPAESLGLYLVPLAVGNFFGPVLMGRLFDTVGRKRMISLTYILSGLLLVVASWLFLKDMLTATTQAIAWMLVFLRRFLRRQFRLSYRQRNLSARNSRARHLYLLCVRNPGGRRFRTISVRLSRRHRFPHLSLLGLSRRSLLHDPWRPRRDPLGRRR